MGESTMPKVNEDYIVKTKAQIMRDMRERRKEKGLVGFRREVTPEQKVKLENFYKKLMKQDSKKSK